MNHIGILLKLPPSEREWLGQLLMASAQMTPEEICNLLKTVTDPITPDRMDNKQLADHVRHIMQEKGFYHAALSELCLRVEGPKHHWVRAVDPNSMEMVFIMARRAMAEGKLSYGRMDEEWCPISRK